MPTEEERAAAFRATQRARSRAKAQAERDLRGDPAALRELQDRFRPLEPGQEVPLIGERR